MLEFAIASDGSLIGIEAFGDSLTMPVALSPVDISAKAGVVITAAVTAKAITPVRNPFFSIANSVICAFVISTFVIFIGINPFVFPHTSRQAQERMI
jgi:hypothetical protein